MKKDYSQILMLIAIVSVIVGACYFLMVVDYIPSDASRDLQKRIDSIVKSEEVNISIKEEKYEYIILQSDYLKSLEESFYRVTLAEINGKGYKKHKFSEKEFKILTNGNSNLIYGYNKSLSFNEEIIVNDYNPVEINIVYKYSEQYLDFKISEEDIDLFKNLVLNILKRVDLTQYKLTENNLEAVNKIKFINLGTYSNPVIMIYIDKLIENID